MIREFTLKDINDINILLLELNYQISENSINNEFSKILVYDDKLIKGVLIYSLIYDRIEIEYISVDKLYRNQEIGTKFIDYICSNNKIKNITLEVRKSNQIAILFYKKNGFIAVATRKNYYNNEDGILMMREVGE